MNQPTTELAIKPANSPAKEAAKAHLASKGITWTETNAPEVSGEPIARTLDEFVRPEKNDPAELIKNRFLCRKGGLLLVGPTGHGKSSLAMQLMIKWGLGQTALGLEPARPLKSLLIQAENDDGDLAEMRHGVFSGLNLTENEVETACKSVLVAQESSKKGGNLCHDVIEPLLKAVKPDLLWIDPALAYVNGDMNSQKDVGNFLRSDLAPLIAKYDCGLVIIHHTNKISKDPEKQTTDFTYLGAGSAEWSNWSRAILALNKTDVDNLYELVAAKRGARLKWKNTDGVSLTMKRYIGHCKRPDTICWVERTVADLEELRASNGKTADDVLKHVPQQLLIGKSELIKVCGQNKIGKHLADELIKELVDDEQLYEVPVSRTGTKPKMLLSRKPVTSLQNLTLDVLTQNSQGHYVIPNKSEPIPKTL